MAQNSLILDNFLTEIADVIRIKKEIVDESYPINPQNFAQEILEIGGADNSELELSSIRIQTNLGRPDNSIKAQGSFYDFQEQKITYKKDVPIDVDTFAFDNIISNSILIVDLSSLTIDTQEQINYIEILADDIIDSEHEYSEILFEIDGFFVIKVGTGSSLIDIHYVIPS